MNLKRYFLMFIICVSSFIIYTNNVNAQNSTSLVNLYGLNYNTNGANVSNWSTTSANINFDIKPTTSGGLINITFNDAIIPQYSNYFIYDLNFINKDSQNKFVCSSTTNRDAVFYLPYDFITTYNDGSTSISDYNYGSNGAGGQYTIPFTYCNTFSIDNDNLGIDVLYVTTTGLAVQCPIISNNNNVMAICPIGGGSSNGNTYINTIRLTFYASNFNNIYHIRSNSRFIYSIDPTQTILNSISNQTDAINNKLNELKQNQQATTQAVNEQTNTMKDSSIDNDSTSSSASGWSSKNASNGTITQLLTLPISLLTNITNSINSSCSSFSLGTLFDTELVLPCINLNDYLGSTLVSIIDILFSGFMIYNIAKKLIKIFNDFTNLKSNQIDEIYGGGNE